MPGLEDPDRAPVFQQEARALPTAPCPDCGEPVIRVHDSSRGAPALADPGPQVVLVIGSRTDGIPLVSRPCNGLALHHCRRPS